MHEVAVKILVTTSRMPHALDEIRKLGQEGHEVYATDTFRTSPGSHSGYVKESFITPSPAYEPARFVASIDAIARTRHIDLIVPSFEEVFVLAKHTDLFAPPTKLLCAPFAVLAQLHDKAAFVELARSLGLAMPDTCVATSTDDLARATAAYREWFARPAFSRGGVDMFSNVGPVARLHALEECQPTKERPWIVQSFVHGEDVCSFSVVHGGRVFAHAAYVHAKTIEHAGGILLESIDEPKSLAITRRIVEHLQYEGQIALDYIRTPKDLVLVECNPRPTAGVCMMEAKPFVDALLARGDGPPHVVPAGIRRMIGVAILRDMLRDWREIPSDVKALFSDAQDIYVHTDDVMPALYEFLSYSHVFAFRRRFHKKRHQHSDLVAAQFYDIAWNGEALP